MADVRLRSVSLDDAEVITELLAGDTELALRTASIPIPYTLEGARQFLRSADPERVFAITVGSNLVGMTGILHECEIGYWIGRVFWGRGYATAAVSAVVDRARSGGMQHLIAEVFPDNAASMRVLEKNGFTCAGEVERNLPLRGGLRRLLRYIL